MDGSSARSYSLFGTRSPFEIIPSTDDQEESSIVVNNPAVTNDSSSSHLRDGEQENATGIYDLLSSWKVISPPSSSGVQNPSNQASSSANHFHWNINGNELNVPPQVQPLAPLSSDVPLCAPVIHPLPFGAQPFRNDVLSNPAIVYMYPVAVLSNIDGRNRWENAAIPNQQGLVGLDVNPVIVPFGLVTPRIVPMYINPSYFANEGAPILNPHPLALNVNYPVADTQRRIIDGNHLMGYPQEIVGSNAVAGILNPHQSNFARGLSRSEINILGFKWVLRNTDDICTICHVAFVRMQVVRDLPCNHRFHAYCIDNWLRESTRCPLCREDLTQFFNR